MTADNICLPCFPLWHEVSVCFVDNIWPPARQSWHSVDMAKLRAIQAITGWATWWREQITSSQEVCLATIYPIRWGSNLFLDRRLWESYHSHNQAYFFHCFSPYRERNLSTTTLDASRLLKLIIGGTFTHGMPSPAPTSASAGEDSSPAASFQ